MESTKNSTLVRNPNPVVKDRKAYPKASKHLSRLLQWYAQLNLQNLQSISQYYTEELFFKDPVVEVYSLEQLQKYYARMLRRMNHADILFENIVEESHQAFVSWVMSARGMNKDYTVHGTSHFKFNRMGLCDYHRDYFDLTEEIYERMPLVGRFFKGIKRIFH